MQIHKQQNRIEGHEIIAFADKRIYTKSTILKCLYWHGALFQTNLTLVDNNTYQISLKLIDGADSKVDLSEHLQKLERDLVDFSLREIVLKETKNVRDLLIAKAFAHLDSVEEPPGEMADPVGLQQ
jgi:His-Xaa-Ser system protein HxsD